MTNLTITNLEESTTLDQAAMRDVHGGILPLIIGGGIVAGAAYAMYRFFGDDDAPESMPSPVEPAPQERSGALRDIQKRAEYNQRTLRRLGR